MILALWFLPYCHIVCMRETSLLTFHISATRANVLSAMHGLALLSLGSGDLHASIGAGGCRRRQARQAGRLHLGTVAGSHSAPARRPPTCSPPANPTSPSPLSPNLEPGPLTHLNSWARTAWTATPWRRTTPPPHPAPPTTSRRRWTAPPSTPRRLPPL